MQKKNKNSVCVLAKSLKNYNMTISLKYIIDQAMSDMPEI